MRSALQRLEFSNMGLEKLFLVSNLLPRHHPVHVWSQRTDRRVMYICMLSMLELLSDAASPAWDC